LQRTLCPKYQIWSKETCQCEKSNPCTVRGCYRGWKFDTTTCECYKKTPVVQRYLCPAGYVFCVHCGKCLDMRNRTCPSYLSICKTGRQVFDESVCECINIEAFCVQKYVCIETHYFDFDKCICVRK
jgi:CXCXC repeat